jgi:AraC-like DNA-binding protein/quercetin dioxygenase-like cupin family protein
MSRNTAPDPTEPAFISRQVTEVRRYYLNLTPSPRAAFEVVCGGVERMSPEYVVRRHDFPYFGVELIVDGEGSVVLNGRRFRLAPGAVFAYGPGVAHTIRNDAQHRMRKYYVTFAGREALALLKAAGLARWKALHVSALHEVAELFEALWREAREDTALAHTLCQMLVRLLLLKIQQLAIPSGRSVPRAFETYERLRRHIEEHHLRVHTVDEIARECHVTPIYASRLFRRFGRTGAYQFLLRLKMNHAAELLEGGLLVKEAAARLGFADAFQFSRAFKRVHGVPPTQLLGNAKRPSV